MSHDIENELRRALRPVDPPAGFAARIVAALPPRESATTLTVLPAPARANASRWQRLGVPATLAASLVVGLLTGQHLAAQRFEREEQAGLAASRELMRALRVTSQKLDLAWEAVRKEPEPDPGTDRSETRT